MQGSTKIKFWHYTIKKVFLLILAAIFERYRCEKMKITFDNEEWLGEVHFDSEFSCVFYKTELEMTTFIDCTFVECTFNRCNFKDVTFTDCAFIDCKFFSCQFEEFYINLCNKFNGIIWDACNFHYSDLSELTLLYNWFFNCEFKNTDLRYIVFYETVALNNRFYNCDGEI